MSSVDQRFGELAVRLGFITAEQLAAEQEIKARQAPLLPLQAWLAKRGRIGPAQNAEIARAFRDATKPPAKLRQIGRYEILEEIGRGAMGVVWRARDTILQRDVAIKTLDVSHPVAPDQVARFLREARTAAQLQHPGIVPIYDVGVDGGAPYFAMGLVRGAPFDRLLQEGKLPDPRERVRIVHRIAEAIAHAHDRRVIHRDLKPSNVLIDEQGGVHVTDLGLAKSIDDSGQITGTSEVLGTPRYLAPEQLNGVRANSTPASDVYALGVILYEILTGTPPFRSRNLAELLAKIMKGEAARPSAVDPSVPAELERICLKAMNRDARSRYPSARGLATELEAYLAGGGG